MNTIVPFLSVKKSDNRNSPCCIKQKKRYDKLSFGCNIPENLYHFTRKTAIEKIFECGYIKPGPPYDKIEGVFLASLKEFFKYWMIEFQKKPVDIRQKLLLQIAKTPQRDVGVLRVRTKNLNKDIIRIRSLDKVHQVLGREGTIVDYTKMKDIDQRIKHATAGYRLDEINAYPQEAIEFVHSGIIPTSEVEIAGITNAKPLFDNKSPREFFERLFKGTPEEAELVNFSEIPRQIEKFKIIA